MDEITAEFLSETRENLDRLDHELLTLEKEPDNSQLLSSVFRTIHTIKGTAGFLNFTQLQQIGHSAESVLSILRDGKIPFTSDLASLLFEAVDCIKIILRDIEDKGEEGAYDYVDLLGRLAAAAEQAPEAPDAAESPVAPDFEEVTAWIGPAAEDVEEAPTLSLDDLAALLLQLEPSDTTGTKRLANALAEISAQADFSAKTREIVHQAVKKLEKIAQKEAEDPEQALAEAGDLIGKAIKSSESGDSIDETPAELREDVAQSPWELPADSDLEFLNEFVAESRESIESAEAALLSLEVDPAHSEAQNTVFRAFHTIKGTSAFLNLSRISELAHHAESLLVPVRDGKVRFSSHHADLALRSVDVLKELVAGVEAALSGQPMSEPAGYGELLDALSHPEFLPPEDDTYPRIGDILVAAKKADREKVDDVASKKGTKPIGVALVNSKTASLTDVAKALRTQQRMIGLDTRAESSVRVRTERLDQLIDMVGELVIAQSMVDQDRTLFDGNHHNLHKKINHAGKIVRELQDLSMSMRMVPFRGTFQKMARLVRDLSHKSGKPVDFIGEGEDTEIDRNMVDAITDPLVHMVRNSVDHGIEPPEVRQRTGKPATGTVRLSAYHSSGNVVVKLQDDGQGLNREKILQKALATGLIDSDKNLSDNEIYNLIFSPGFSTAAKVTDVSGRGVGMDVVRKNIESLRGRINITSEPGRGCTFWLNLPLTLAITDGMLVKVGKECYIIPTINIHLSFRPDRSALSSIGGRGDLVILRGETMPMFRLHRLFNVTGAIEDPLRALLVVVGDGDRRCALLVDELLGQQQVVAKSLGEGLGKIQGISGGAILGDGRVGLILDTPEIVSLARQGLDGKGSPGRAVTQMEVR